MILRKFVGKDQVLAHSGLYHQLGISGDDVDELLEKIHGRFGTSFAGFKADDLLSDEERR